MPLDNDFFTPEQIDEQIEQLSRTSQANRLQVHDRHYMRLMQHLRRFYRTNPEEDVRSLDSAWERITHERVHAKVQLNEPGQVSEMRSPSEKHVPRAKKTLLWRQLGILAAIMVIGLLVGSMLLVLNQARQGKLGIGVKTTPGATVTHKPVQDAQLNLYISDFVSVYKIDSKTGKRDWTFTPHERGAQFPLIVDGVVYFSSNTYVYALNASDGSLRWKLQYTFLNAVAHGIVYVSSIKPDNIHIDLDALDASTGKVLWHYNPGLQVGTVAVSNGVLYGTGSVDMSFDGALYALNATSGIQLWHIQVQDQGFNTPQIVNDVVYATSTRDNKNVNPPVRSGYVYAFDAKTGIQLWRTSKINEYIPAEPVVVQGVMYFVTNKTETGTSFLYAMRAGDGSVIWKKFIDGDTNAAPLVINDVVYTEVSGSFVQKSSILALKIVDGSVIWSHPLTNSMEYSFSPLVANNGVMYVSTEDGKVLALNVSDGSLLRVYQLGHNPSMVSIFAPLITLAP